MLFVVLASVGPFELFVFLDGIHKDHSTYNNCILWKDNP
jgi:hypothetical protein